MADAKAAWDDVGNRFADLGKQVKQRYETNAALDDQKEKVNDALRQLGDALDKGFTALGDSLRDPQIRDDLKGAGAAMATALSTTFEQVAEEIKKAVKK